METVAEVYGASISRPDLADTTNTDVGECLLLLETLLGLWGRGAATLKRLLGVLGWRATLLSVHSVGSGAREHVAGLL